MSHESDRSEVDEYAREHRRLWDTTVSTLTAAVRLRHPDDGEIDFAGFLASALAAVAGNVGSIHRITAGRSGSWEADLVHQLLAGTVGDDENALLAYRTQPVVVPLNVAQLVSDAREDAPEVDRARMLPSLDEALDALPNPYADGRSPSDEEYERFDVAEDTLRRDYAAAYAAYARAFEAAVHALASDLSDLPVPVTVRVDADPDSPWWSKGAIQNPGPWDEPGVTGRLWSAAREKVGMPGLGMPVS